ncbi:hypothetical protein ZEAMMB73_Zm00001d020630 [Zea mays]|uniref:Uncharacterized protein n=1 Tax=Zea mays TaxID=4577 RepID=A0A1D6I5A8_MAIZE|nr:hypothetical protein ZEAMMB73_Zm00001d020630 [Zea mays]
MEAHPTGAAIPSPMAAPQPPPSSTTTPPPTATPQEPAATAVTAVRSPQPVRFAFLVVAALMSASWFVEPFSAAAAADLRVPWPAVVATLVCFTALFCASVLLFGSFFMLRPPLAAAVMDAQWKGVRAFAAVFAAVAIGVAACLVGASGSAYGSGGMHQLVAE